jgi:hypothetical protein
VAGPLALDFVGKLDGAAVLEVVEGLFSDEEARILSKT